MSFMYNPFPYDDPDAVNRISVDPALRGAVAKGLSAGVAVLSEAVKSVLGKKRACVVALDGYVSAPFETVARQLARHLQQDGVQVRVADTSSLFMEESLLAGKLLKYLPEDREEDPPLLYGRLYHEGYEGLMDPAKVASMAAELGRFASGGDCTTRIERLVRTMTRSTVRPARISCISSPTY